MIIECPHCFTRISEREDGICLACRNNYNEVSEENRDKSSIEIIEDQEFPDVCLVCGRDNVSSRYEFSSYHDMTKEILGETGLIEKIIMLICGFLGGCAAYISKGIETERSVRVNIPVCDDCYKSKKEIKSLNVLYEERKMKVVSHKLFKEALEKWNEKYKL